MGPSVLFPPAAPSPRSKSDSSAGAYFLAGMSPRGARYMAAASGVIWQLTIRWQPVTFRRPWAKYCCSSVRPSRRRRHRTPGLELRYFGTLWGYEEGDHRTCVLCIGRRVAWLRLSADSRLAPLIMTSGFGRSRSAREPGHFIPFNRDSLNCPFLKAHGSTAGTRAGPPGRCRLHKQSRSTRPPSGWLTATGVGGGKGRSRSAASCTVMLMECAPIMARRIGLNCAPSRHLASILSQSEERDLALTRARRAQRGVSARAIRRRRRAAARYVEWSRAGVGTARKKLLSWSPNLSLVLYSPSRLLRRFSQGRLDPGVASAELGEVIQWPCSARVITLGRSRPCHGFGASYISVDRLGKVPLGPRLRR